MKHLKLFFALFAMLALGVGNAWAEEATLTFTKACGGTGTDSKGNTWTVTSDAAESTYDGTKGIHYGTSKKAVSYLQVSTSTIPGTVSKIVVNASGASGTSAKLNVQVGGAAFGSQVSLTSNAAEYIFTGEASGEIIVKATQTSAKKALYIKSIVVTYTTSGGGEPATPVQLGTPSNLNAVPAETSATLSWGAVTNANNYSVTVNGNTSEVSTTTYEATGLTADTEYTWSVTAKGDGINYTDSEVATSTFTTAATSITPDPGASSANVTYDFTKIDGFSSWESGYAKHIVRYSDAVVTFVSANKQQSTITDQPVTKGGDVTLVMTDGSTLSSVEWVCTKWGSKAQTITLHYSTDGGNTYTSTSVTSTTFTISSNSLPAGTNAVKITFSSTNNQVGITSCTITKVTSDEPQPDIVKTLKSIAVTPTTTTYEQGDVFSFEGTCTATYSVTKDGVAQEDETKEVTPTSVSTPDMSTTGDKVVTVSYTESEVTVETTYTITVTENTIVPGTYPGNLNNVFFGCSVGNNAEEQSGKLEDILVVSGCTQSAQNKTSYQSDHVRYYADNYLKFSAPAGYLISAIQFTAYSGSFKWDGEITATVGTYDADGKSWTGSAQEVQFNFGKQNRIASVSVTYAEASKYALTIATPSNGTLTVKEGENAVATGDKFYAGTQLTVTATPEEGYKFASVSVVDGSSNDVTASVYDNGTLTMPEYDVTISATFETAKTLTSIEITTAATQTTFWQGETFNYTGLEVTAHFDGAADEVVTPTVTGSTASAGTQTVTVSYTEGTVTKSTSYEITVKAIPNTKETAYSVADAYDIIDKLTTATGVFITGTISQVDSYNSTYKSITYWISADGTITKQLQVYSGKGLASADFSNKTDLSVGDQVIVCGNLKKFSGTYEFDKNNYLASHTPTTKDPAGLAYATTSYTANVGEAFTTPELTNPHNLDVTYSTSDASKATVDANNGAVTIVAAGVVTITATTTGDATHDAGTASYTITISDPSLVIAQLPFTYNSGKAAIETTAGITQEGLGSDYTSAGSPKLKFDHTGDNVVICFGSQADELSYDIKGNPSQGTFSCTFAVQESEDGSTYTDLVTYTTLETTTTNKTHKLAPASRYVKFVFTEKSNGNVALGNISITKPDLRAEAGIAWNPATVSLTVGDAFTAPTFTNPNGLSGITFVSDNETLATVDNAGVISLVSGKTGTATITATYAGNETYKAAEVTCVITVSPKTENVVILAQLEGQWYAMTGAYVSGKTNVLSAIPVEYINGTLYNVSEADKASIEWQRSMNGNKAIFKNGDNYLTGDTDTDLTLKTTEFEWDYNGVNYLCNDGKRTFLYCENTKTNVFGFKNYAISNAGSVKSNSDGTTESYSSTPVVTTPIYKTATFYTRSELTVGNYGTICLPYAVNNFTGATFYKVAGKEGKKIIFDEVTELEAGKPYIFMAEAAEIKLAQVGDEYTGNAQLYNSLQGTFTQIKDAEAGAAGNILEGNYMVVNNVIKMCGANCGLKANRAYFVATELEDLEAPQSQMPGRRRISLNVTSENTTTGLDNITNGKNTTIKVIENGQLIIIRNGEKFNAQGIKL